MLQCPRTQGYPLKLEVAEAKRVKVEFSKEFLERMIGRLDWATFRSAAAPLTGVDLPVDVPDSNSSERTWKDIHHALMEWDIIRGVLKAEDGTRYEIKDGIPNLIIAEAVQPTGAHDEQVAADVEEEQT